MTQLAEQHDASTATHEATPQRLQDARRQGRVARSADLTAAAVILTAVVLVAWLGGYIVAGLRDMTAMLLDGRSNPLASPAALAESAGQALQGVLVPLVGIMAGLFMAALAAGIVQVGAVRSAEPIKPQWNRVSPLAGLQRIASRRTAVRVGFTLGKLSLAGVVVVTTLQAYWQRLLQVGAGDTHSIGEAAGSALGRAAWPLALGLTALAVLDRLYQRWQHRWDLKMTHAQWREDRRRQEGDPAVRHHMRRRGEQRRQRPGVAVWHATAVLSAPGGPALAIRYAAGMRCPHILATGHGRDAEQIRRRAEENEIPVVLVADLAARLAAVARSGQAVPRRWQQDVLDVLEATEGVTA
ncbi:MAG: EscU/YscU/HrcU family type III secretion system export apparatus switch protein [Phycisphaerae bacterium]|nr:EscU/YscU/HrcU family type III secretion system export apparatus switch protein [Phycisphaerae bacterium]